MKISRFFVLLGLVGLTASAAMADGIDPTVVIRQVDPVPTVITDPAQIVPVFATTGQNAIGLQNGLNVTLISLTLTVTGLLGPLDFSFGEDPGANIFSQFASMVNPNGSTTLTFFGVDESHTGLLPSVCNSDSDLDADDCTGPIYSLEFSGIPNGAIVVGAITVSTPEPASLLLLSAGLAGLAAFRKRKASLQN